MDRRGPLRRHARGGDRRRGRAGRDPHRRTWRPSGRPRSRSTAINEREKVTDHDTAAFVDVLGASAGEAGRWIHYGLTSSDVVDTGLALQLKRAGALLVPRRRASLAWELAEKAREHAGTLCVGRTHGVHAEPTSFGLKLGRLRDGGAPQRRAARARVRPGGHGRDLRRGRHVRDARPRLRGARAGPARAGPRGDLHPGRPARPPRRAAVGHRAGRRRAGALRHGDPPPPAHRGARGGGAVPGRARRARARCRTSATRWSPSASAGSPGCCGATPRWGWRTSRCGTSATSRTPRPSGSCCPTRRSCSTRCSRSPLRVVRGMVVHADRMLANLELTSGALFSQRVLLALVSSAACSATTPTGSSSAWPSRPGTPRRRCAHCWSEEGVELDLDEVFDYGYYVRHVPEALARLEVIPCPAS